MQAGVIEIFEEAAADRRRGASEIEETLVRDLLAARSRWQPDALHAGAGYLADGHPVMGNLRALAERARAGDPDSFAVWLERRQETLKTLPARLAQSSWLQVVTATRIITLSRSAAVAAVVEGAWSKGWPGSVVVLDDGFSGCGKDQALRLAKVGEAVSQPDTSADEWLVGPGLLVLAGADAVGPSRFINAFGTKGLFELASSRGIARGLIADTGKDVSEEVLSDIEQRLPRVRDAEDRTRSTFEVVPLDLVSFRVTE
jgi:translation initiation factor 2B subunit (eIF-2B alpha/beta/delta family)